MSSRLSFPLAYLITAGECDQSNFDEESARILSNIEAAVNEGTDLVQIREKRLSGKLLMELAERAVKITQGSRTKLLINDRSDIALAVGADGVHLTSTSLPARAVRDKAPRGFCIGVSVHTVDEARDAVASEADFALFGPIFPSPEKGSGVGTEALRELCTSVAGFPVVAVGGVDEANVSSVLEAGAAGFAGIRAFDDPDSVRRIMTRTAS